MRESAALRLCVCVCKTRKCNAIHKAICNWADGKKDSKHHALNRVVVERGEKVRRDAEAIQLLSERAPVLAFVNNHYAGYAPATVEELRQALGQA